MVPNLHHASIKAPDASADVPIEFCIGEMGRDRSRQGAAMFVNRFGELLEGLSVQIDGTANIAPAPRQQILPLVSAQAIYQAAAERAYRDHQLDRLFNADYYGDNGSGI